MRRGEVFISVKRSGHGRLDPLVLAVVFGIGGLIFLVLTIVVPAVISANNKNIVCTSAEFLRPGEQQVCYVNAKGDFVAKVDEEASSLVTNYRMPKENLGKIVTGHRVYHYESKANLKNGPLVFPITSSFRVNFTAFASCTGDWCRSVGMYNLAYENYKKATAKGKFDEKYYSPIFTGLNQNGTVYRYGNVEYSAYYLVFANGNQEATVSLVVDIDYSAHDLRGAAERDEIKATPFGDKNRIVFDDVQTNEIIVMEYLDDEHKGPELINATITKYRPKAGLIAFLAILFSLLTIACFAMTVIFVLAMFGKLPGKLGAKVQQKVQKSESSYYQAPDVAAEDALNASSSAADPQE